MQKLIGIEKVDLLTKSISEVFNDGEESFFDKVKYYIDDSNIIKTKDNLGFIVCFKVYCFDILNNKILWISKNGIIRNRDVKLSLDEKKKYLIVEVNEHYQKKKFKHIFNFEGNLITSTEIGVIDK